MNDELTPEERDALKSLPRERMPSAGLENRVVAAMRDRGALAPAPRARVIRLTTPRVATLVAAGIALMIGAYSIGMHRGSFRPDVRETLEPRTAERTIMDEAAPVETSEDRATPATQPEALALQSRPEPKAKENAATEKLDWKLKDTSTRGDMAESTERARTLESVPNEPEPAAPAPAQQFARELDATMAKKSEAPAQLPPATDLRATEAPSNTREYALGTTRFTVGAPDSIHVEADQPGRMLLVHTADGLVRIRVPGFTTMSKSTLMSQNAPTGSTTRTIQLGGRGLLVDAPATMRIEQDADDRTILIHTSGGIVRVHLAG
jgi:hypothetical protein